MPSLDPRRPSGRLATAIALLSCTAVIAALAPVATGTPAAGTTLAGAATAKARNGTVAGVMQHLRKLEAIGAEHGNRASGTTGYRASRDYVVKRLTKAGYHPTVQAFDVHQFEQVGAATLTRTAPAPRTYAEGSDFVVMQYSGSGDVTGRIAPVDLALDDIENSTSGCEAADFASFPAGDIALIRRGTCTFDEKVANAQEAGATGVIVMNQGTEGRTDVLDGYVGEDLVDVPVLGIGFALGSELAEEGTEVHLAAQTRIASHRTWNVLAETPGRRTNVVMAGAHLDSVPEGPGINDNGSGSAALLEIAERLADRVRAPHNRVRFAWWGAEELGIFGSQHYVDDLAAHHRAKLKRIALYLNFDMIASPNYALMVYDGDGSASVDDPDAVPMPQGSAAIERLFHRFFERRGAGSTETPAGDRSDHRGFLAHNIPIGGLFTGAEEIKSEADAARFGGTAGEPYDACYHEACDTLDNVDARALKLNFAAIKYAIRTYAASTKAVNGKR